MHGRAFLLSVVIAGYNSLFESEALNLGRCDHDQTGHGDYD
jgi:hypothetical protein